MKTKRIVLHQKTLGPMKHDYVVKEALNVADWPMGKFLTKDEVQAIIDNRIDPIEVVIKIS